MHSSSNSNSNDIPTASLETVKFAALEQKDASEIKKLLAASVSAGFYYLDFAGSSAAHLPGLKEDLLKVMEEYFNQHDDVKKLDSDGSTTRGYVKHGTFSAVDPNKPNESFEHLAIGTYSLHTSGAATLPGLFQKAGKLVPNYISTCERIVNVLLTSYSHALALPDLTQHHNHANSSDTILALLSYPGQLTHQKHTDLGSLTILFSDQWGLQVITPSTGQWEWVEPRQRDAIMNVGDGLRFLSGKKLYSCVHRVVRDGRASGEGHRYSIAYLLRPEDEAVFEDADGTKVTARDLAKVKYNTYAAGHEEQAKSSVLTGGMEKVLGVNA
ncbi:hypothetical protein FQN52_009629 [Onygenales sp. PD_12]|nr:hypothetical protein FQN52_009629 [Onygenales sp. PD_12]